ncbi:MAG: phospholipid carrier-dependent glycosyltransferase [Frankiales bacterium]|nr:phospholipid carrier-dependent glycosyltransferase [Frankiales bacterium]
MTATLDRTAAADVDQSGWRDRLRPLVTGSGGWPVTLAVTVLAGLLRFLRLDQPATNLSNGKVVAGDIFDELYYACDAHSLMTYGVEHATSNDAQFCALNGSSPAFVVHPPLGKWLIGVGEQLMGFNTWGWRISAAVFGTLTVLLLIRIARRMTGSTLLGGLAGLFLALDGLHFVQSRIATLDVFLCFFVVAAFGALVIDRDRIRARLAEASEEQLARGGPLGWRPWRLVAGLMMGCALATKWSALYPIAVMLVLTLFWEAGARRAAGLRAPWRTTVRQTTAPFVGVFLVLPVAVYVGSWTGWFVTKEGWDRQWAKDNPHTDFPFVPASLRSFWHYHWEMWHFHQTLEKTHPYQSHPLSWPFLQRPVSYYYPSPIKTGVYGCQTSTGCSREVLAIGTPALWWAMLPVAIALLFRWASKRDWASASVLLLMLVSILAWIPSDQKHRTMFLFYALPSVPFLCLGLAIVVGWVVGPPGSTRRIWGSGAAGVYTSLVVLNFWWLYPVLAAVTIPYTSWHHRMWFTSWI